ncbi:hypothetical protein K492DRAFT_195354 [Lichtheimia hyalospora FSU 10163]|nr:hypothetical protein K492DRAFT_195354 [Lichtheimia hyalospora FSU 10163]
MTTDNHERSRKRRYEEMTDESEQQNDRVLLPKKRRRIVDEMMEVDGPSGDPARVDNYFFDQDTQEYFFSFIGILQMLRIYYPDIQNEVNLLDLDLNHLMRLYHDVTLSNKNFVQPAAIFQKRLKSLCQNRIVFNRDTVRFPPTVSWPFIQI